jgi:sensor histidine kinase regulating citrate/malate metabolism
VGRGLGLVSIEERVKLLRGQLTVRSARGQGTTIDVAVPDRHQGPNAIRVGQGPIAFHQSR